MCVYRVSHKRIGCEIMAGEEREVEMQSGKQTDIWTGQRLSAVLARSLIRSFFVVVVSPFFVCVFFFFFSQHSLSGVNCTKQNTSSRPWSEFDW